MYKYIILIHILAATIWAGGHLILSITILPEALKKKSPKVVTDFEQKYEKIGIPALILLVLSGLYLAYTMLPDLSQWFSFETHISSHISIKLILLLTTIVFAIHARFRLIPNLTKETLPLLASHIILVTIVACVFVATGLSFRMGIF